MNPLFKKPSAWLPVVMSIVALLLVVGFVATHGLTPDPTVACVGDICRPDEGTLAHLWQLLMGLQIPLVMYFVAKYLPQAPKQALRVLVVQAALFLASCATLFTFTHLTGS